MQLKCPSGHSRLKQGLHSRSSLRICALGESGGVNFGLLEPNSASIGLFSAAARCINPESLLMTSCAQESKAIASPRSVLPHRLRLAWLPSATIFSAISLSLAEPTIHTANPCFCRRWAISAK